MDIYQKLHDIDELVEIFLSKNEACISQASHLEISKTEY